MKHIALLINPQKNQILSAYKIWVLDQIESKQPTWIVEVFDSFWPKGLDLFDEVWVMGGDGTYNYFVNQYPTCQKPIGLLKGGTGNDFYWKIFGGLSREKQLNHLVAGNSEWVDAGQVNNKLFLNGVGIGIEGEVLHAMDTIRHIGGALGYYLAAIPALFRFKDYKANRKPVFLWMVFNSVRAGGGFHFFPMASIQDGKLDMMTCDPLPVWKRLFYMPIIQSGRHTRLSFLHFSTIESKRVVCDRILKAQVDGEVLEAKTFDFTILPAKFKFIVPKS